MDHPTRKATPADYATRDVDLRLQAIKAQHPASRPHRRARWDRILTLAALALLAGSAAWAAIYQVTLALATSPTCTP